MAWVTDREASKLPFYCDGMEFNVFDPLVPNPKKSDPLEGFKLDPKTIMRNEVIEGVGTIITTYDGTVYGYFDKLAPIKYVVDTLKPPVGPPLREKHEGLFGFRRETKKSKFYRRVYQVYLKAYYAEMKDLSAERF